MSDFFWPSKDDVLTVHDISIARFGGTSGIRDEGLLDSALARPFASFGAMTPFLMTSPRHAPCAMPSSRTIHSSMETNALVPQRSA